MNLQDVIVNMTNVPPTAFTTKQFSAPVVNGPIRQPNLQTIGEAETEEYEWLKEVRTAVEKDQLDKDEWISANTTPSNITPSNKRKLFLLLQS